MNNKENPVPFIKTNWLNVFAGLFGIELSYHTCNVDQDAYLVISLILFKFIFKIKRSVYEQDYYKKYEYNTYGFYFEHNPDKFVIEWGSDFYKKWTMPWNLVILKRSLLNNKGKYIQLKENTIDAVENELDERLNDYLHYGDLFDISFSYHVVKNVVSFNALKSFKPFYKTRYEITVYFDVEINGYDKLVFDTSTDEWLIEKIGTKMLELYNKYK